MKVEKGNAYAIKLTSGQELVGNVIDIDDEYYYLEKPLTIGQGQKGMEFLPIMFTGIHLSDSPLRKTAVALLSPVRPDVLEAYKDSIDPKQIVTPKKQIITG